MHVSSSTWGAPKWTLDVTQGMGHCMVGPLCLSVCLHPCKASEAPSHHAGNGLLAHAPGSSASGAGSSAGGMSARAAQEAAAEQELARLFNKQDFARMKVGRCACGCE